jgi:hypothetical protein
MTEVAIAFAPHRTLEALRKIGAPNARCRGLFYDPSLSPRAFIKAN